MMRHIPDTPRTVRVDDLVGVADIAARSQWSVSTVGSWRRRRGFPDSVFWAGGKQFWVWPEVAAWLRDTGRMR